MRILGIDPGERRVGLAISDELRITAQGLDTFDRKSGKSLLGFIAGLIEKFGINEVVVGHPISLSGKRCSASEKAEKLASQIESSLKVKTTVWDERLSSEQAKRILRGSRAGKGAVDKISAVIILQNYLDYLKGQTEHPENGQEEG